MKTAGYILLLILTLQAVTPRTATASLVITEVMHISNHRYDNPDTDGDWWELSNTYSYSYDLTGYYWTDAPTSGDKCYFNGITIAAGDSIIILDEENYQKAELWKSEWNLSAQTNVYDRSYFDDTFSNLGYDDGIIIYNSNDFQIASASYNSPIEGCSLTWDINGTPLGISVNGLNGAYQSTNSSPDVASPGFVVPEPTSAITLLVLSIIATTRQKSSNTLKI